MTKWIPITDSRPYCRFETSEDPNSNGYAQFDGEVSQSVELTDGSNWARGHYRDDGKWIVYGSEHDFLMVKPEDITHWAEMIKLPER